MKNRYNRNQIGCFTPTHKLNAKPFSPELIMPVNILKPDQAAALLRSCEDPLVVLQLVLPLFAGLRPDEVARLQWCQFNPGESITVCSQRPTGQVGMMMQCVRTIIIQRVLEAWLKPFYGCNPIVFTDPVIRQQVSQVLRSAGIVDIRQLRQTFLIYSLEFCRDYLIGWELMVDVELKDLQGRFFPAIPEDVVDRMFTLTPTCVGITDWRRRVVRALKRFPAAT